MRLEGITFQGPALDDEGVFAILPASLQVLLKQINGFILYGGALHVRGACSQPSWHSLREAWIEERAFHLLYGQVAEGDVPFAQDCIGDQFLLRDERVYHLAAESGKLIPLHLSLNEFFDAVAKAPFEFLFMEPLRQVIEAGGRLLPGQLLHAHPPYCSLEAEQGVSLRPVFGETLLAYHADLARKISLAGPDGRISMQDYIEGSLLGAAGDLLQGAEAHDRG
jgi:hypothetical protein